MRCHLEFRPAATWPAAGHPDMRLRRAVCVIIRSAGGSCVTLVEHQRHCSQESAEGMRTALRQHEEVLASKLERFFPASCWQRRNSKIAKELASA